MSDLQEGIPPTRGRRRLSGRLATLRSWVKASGPGWLQGAATLGGGTLAGSLYLGVIGGYAFLWLQVFAMAMGVIMLSAITYVTLSTGRRPFAAMNEHINPVLGWGWALGALVANTVWAFPQFSLGSAAVVQNLAPSFPRLIGGEGRANAVVSLTLLAAAVVVVWSYEKGGRGVRAFERILKGMVALVVLCFFGVVVKLALSPGGLPWRSIGAGLVPDLGLLSHPAKTFAEPLAATGRYAGYWSRLIVGEQRSIMITAAATAVGINMTFLMPYSVLRKGWRREARGLAIFDLGTGLFIPFVLATGCVVIASASQFHTRPQPGLLEGGAPPGLEREYRQLRLDRLQAQMGPAAFTTAGPADRDALLAELPEADDRMAAMLVRRDAFNLASALERFTGQTFDRYVFGVGVLGMALSTIILLMLISGFAVAEMLGVPERGWLYRLGCLVPGLGALAPFVWSGKVQFWLAVPTSVFNMTLLPIAYLTFFLMMNNRRLMGADILRGKTRTLVNALMLLALSAASFGAGWTIWSNARWAGVAVVGAFVGLATIVHFVRPRSPSARRPAGAPRGPE